MMELGAFVAIWYILLPTPYKYPGTEKVNSISVRIYGEQSCHVSTHELRDQIIRYARERVESIWKREKCIVPGSSLTSIKGREAFDDWGRMRNDSVMMLVYDAIQQRIVRNWKKRMPVLQMGTATLDMPLVHGSSKLWKQRAWILRPSQNIAQKQNKTKTTIYSRESHPKAIHPGRSRLVIWT